MLDIIKQNKVILIILVIIIIAFAWFGFLREPSAPTSLLTNESRSGSSQAEQDILKILLDMRSIRLDSSIFENPAFASLRDFGRDIVPEPVGRTNPFAPTENFFEIEEDDEAASAVFAE